MKKRMLAIAALSCSLSILSADAIAQVFESPPLPDLRVPRTSQGAKVTQVIGLSEVTIFYHRPGVKGRTIWGSKGSGALLEYGEIWRAGANEPTMFTFSNDVTIAGKRLRAGTYRFLIVPNEKEWTVIFNSEVRNSGTVHEAQYDSLRFNVAPQSGPHEEWLSYSFTDLTPTSATVVVSWETTRLPFKIEFNLLPLLRASTGTSGVLHGAARFALDNNLYLTEALEWVDRSIAMDKTFFNLRTKAEILYLNGNKKEAISLGEEATKLIRMRDIKSLPGFQQQQVADFEKKLADWKRG